MTKHKAFSDNETLKTLRADILTSFDCIPIPHEYIREVWLEYIIRNAQTGRKKSLPAEMVKLDILYCLFTFPNFPSLFELAGRWSVTEGMARKHLTRFLADVADFKERKTFLHEAQRKFLQGMENK